MTATPTTTLRWAVTATPTITLRFLFAFSFLSGFGNEEEFSCGKWPRADGSNVHLVRSGRGCAEHDNRHVTGGHRIQEAVRRGRTTCRAYGQTDRTGVRVYFQENSRVKQHHPAETKYKEIRARFYDRLQWQEYTQTKQNKTATSILVNSQSRYNKRKPMHTRTEKRTLHVTIKKGPPI